VGVRRGATALADARSAGDAEKLRGIAANSWIELTLVGRSPRKSGETPDSCEPGRERGESDLRDVNLYARVRAVYSST